MRPRSIVMLALSCFAAANMELAGQGQDDPKPALKNASSASVPPTAKPGGAGGQWYPLASLPERYENNCAAYLDGALYTFLQRSYRFDISSGTWSSIADLPRGRQNACAEAVHGSVYIFGGRNSLDAEPLKYDPVSNSYTGMKAMPLPVWAAASFVYKGRVWIFGGRNLSGSQPRNSIQIYDPVTNEWIVSTSTLPYPLGHFDAAVVDDKIYFVDNVRPGSNSVGLFEGTFGGDGNTITWEKKRDFPGVDVLGYAMGADKYRIYTVGGAGEHGYSLGFTFSYYAATDTWYQEAKERFGTYNVPMVRDSTTGLFYVIGGYNGQAQVFDPGIPSPPVARFPSTEYSRWTKRSDAYRTEFSLCNDGEIALEWSAVVDGNAPWLTVDAAQGIVSPAYCGNLGVTITPASLNPGPYTGKIYVMTNDPTHAMETLTVSISVQEEDIVEPLNALVEQYTSASGLHCSRGADTLAAVAAYYGDRAICISWHDDDAMELPSWFMMKAWIDVSGFPSASVGRVRWPDQQNMSIDRFQWRKTIGWLIDTGSSPVALSISDKNWNASTNTLTFKVSVFLHQGINADLRLTSVLAEDSLNFAQLRYNLTTLQVDTLDPYYHMSVVRAFEPQVTRGLQLAASNTFVTQSTIEKVMSITAPKGFDPNKARLVVFVHQITNEQKPGPVRQAHAEPMMQGITTAVGRTSVARGFALHQNYPNPFNPSTTLTYDVPRESVVNIAVYDAFGRLLRTVADGTHAAGSYSIQLDGAGLASGTYFVTMRAGSFVQTRSMTLMK